MIALPLIAAISALIAAWAGYMAGHRRGWHDGVTAMHEVLAKALARPQYWTGVNVVYLLRRMKGEKV